MRTTNGMPLLARVLRRPQPSGCSRAAVGIGGAPSRWQHRTDVPPRKERVDVSWTRSGLNDAAKDARAR